MDAMLRRMSTASSSRCGAGSEDEGGGGFRRRRVLGVSSRSPEPHLGLERTAEVRHVEEDLLGGRGHGERRPGREGGRECAETRRAQNPRFAGGLRASPGSASPPFRLETRPRAIERRGSDPLLRVAEEEGGRVRGEPR